MKNLPKTMKVVLGKFFSLTNLSNFWRDDSFFRPVSYAIIKKVNN